MMQTNRFFADVWPRHFRETVVVLDVDVSSRLHLLFSFLGLIYNIVGLYRKTAQVYLKLYKPKR